jgi:hypothetical protein
MGVPYKIVVMNKNQKKGKRNSPKAPRIPILSTTKKGHASHVRTPSLTMKVM